MMPSMRPAVAPLTPWRVLAFTAACVLAYLLWRGPERFYYESFGTLIVSPAIYTRILPAPLNQWLLRLLIDHSSLAYVLYAIPVGMLLLAFAAGIHAVRRNSVPLALAAFVFVAVVFGTYHWLQPLGISLVLY